MRAETAVLKAQLLALPPDERAVLAQEVWDSIEHFVDPEIEQAWLAVADEWITGTGNSISIIIIQQHQSPRRRS